jgi:hypothetical protein
MKAPLLKSVFFLICACLLASVLSLGQDANNTPQASVQSASTSSLQTSAVVAPGGYRLTAWSELGMHCMDGKDYSVFAVLPPYNTLRAQLVQVGSNPVPVTTGVLVTYQAIKDPAGSINTISHTKTNFWNYTKALFGVTLAPDMGLAGYPAQSLTARKLNYNAMAGYWEAVGVPTIPYDDKNDSNAYPMVMVVAKDLHGNTLATASVVLPVSDEMSCKNCHATNSDVHAEPRHGWVNNPDPSKDTKLNILRLHDDRFSITAFLQPLEAKGYHYKSTLEATATSGTPILCAACHASEALGATGVTGVNPLTEDMHRLHGPVVNPQTGQTLDNATTNQGACYLCHPGPKTLCQRGAMSKITCVNCHGSPSAVGQATRQGWLTLPACQMCHENGIRYTSAFASPGHWRVATDTTFATVDNVPAQGFDLYRFSTGHGKLYCSACHGSQHAEFPTSRMNDNVYSTAMQGYPGQLRECTVCHDPVPISATGGPHKMHTVGQTWVEAHHDYAENPAACSYCHGADFRGTALSQLKTTKTFNAGDYGTKSFPAGHFVSCYDCHNGPRPD